MVHQTNNIQTTAEDADGSVSAADYFGLSAVIAHFRDQLEAVHSAPLLAGKSSCHHAERIHRNRVVLFRLRWISPPYCDCKNCCDTGAEKDAHGGLPRLFLGLQPQCLFLG